MSARPWGSTAPLPSSRPAVPSLQLCSCVLMRWPLLPQSPVSACWLAARRCPDLLAEAHRPIQSRQHRARPRSQQRPLPVRKRSPRLRSSTTCQPYPPSPWHLSSRVRAQPRAPRRTPPSLQAHQLLPRPAAPLLLHLAPSSISRATLTRSSSTSPAASQTVPPPFRLARSSLPLLSRTSTPM